MRTLPIWLLALLVGLGCVSTPKNSPGEDRARIPAVLADLVLARDSNEIPPVVFPHAWHHERSLAGQRRGCSDCHHALADGSEALPRPCVTCHPHEAEAGKPPDL